MTTGSRPRAAGDPEGGLFHARAGPVRTRSIPRTPACHGFTIIAKIKPGTSEAIRAYGKTTREGRRGRPARARAAAAALPAVGALRHRRRHVLHVPGHLRHGLRQVHRGRRRPLHEDGHQHDLREARGFPKTGRRTRRRSSSSFASTSARASSSTASIPYVTADEIKKALELKRPSRRCSTRCNDGQRAPGPGVSIRCWRSTTFSISCWRGPRRAPRATSF